MRVIRDLLFFFPRDHQDLTDLRTIDRLEEGVLVSVLGVVDDIDQHDKPGGRSLLGVLIKQDAGYLRPCGSISPFCEPSFASGNW